MAKQTGILAQHRDRMENDAAYRKAALSINPDGAGGAALGKSLPTDEPTSLTVHHDTVDDINQLKGDALTDAVRDAGIEGYSNLTADEKRAALRKARA